MSPNRLNSSIKLHLRSSPVDQSRKKNRIRIPKRGIASDLSRKAHFELISKSVGGWDPTEKFKCMICWKPLDIFGKDASSYMECRHCQQKGHQDHMLRWLAKTNHCPYCRGKWSSLEQ